MKRRRPIDVPPKVPTYAVVPVDEAAVTDALKAHLLRNLGTTPGKLEAFGAVMDATSPPVGIYTALVRQAFPRLSATAQHALVTGLVMTHSPIARGDLQQITPAVIDAISAACADELARLRAGERQPS